MEAPDLFILLLICAENDEERLAALRALDAHICPNTCKVGTKGG